MEHLNKFIVEDCFGKKLVTFSIPQRKVDDFVVEADIPFSYRGTAQMTQTYFFFLLARYALIRTAKRVLRELGDHGDAFFYVRYA